MNNLSLDSHLVFIKDQIEWCEGAVIDRDENDNPICVRNYCNLDTAKYWLDMFIELEKDLGCPLDVREKALNGFYIPSYGYVSNDDDFIYLRKDDKGYYLKVVIHPSKPTPPHFYGYCDIHYLKDYKKTWWLSETKEE